MTVWELWNSGVRIWCMYYSGVGRNFATVGVETYRIQDSPSEGVIAIMNKEGDKRVYFCFWHKISSMLALGRVKYCPVSQSTRNTAACCCLLQNNIVISLDSSTYIPTWYETIQRQWILKSPYKKSEKIGIDHTRIICGPYAEEKNWQSWFVLFFLKRKLSEPKHKEYNRWYVNVMAVVLGGTENHGQRQQPNYYTTTYWSRDLHPRRGVD